MNKTIIASVIAPESKRTAVKLAGSILDEAKAKRHKTELAANAISATRVVVTVIASETQWSLLNGGSSLFCMEDIHGALTLRFFHRKLWVNIAGLE